MPPPGRVILRPFPSGSVNDPPPLPASDVWRNTTATAGFIMPTILNVFFFALPTIDILTSSVFSTPRVFNQ